MLMSIGKSWPPAPACEWICQMTRTAARSRRSAISDNTKPITPSVPVNVQLSVIHGQAVSCRKSRTRSKPEHGTDRTAYLSRPFHTSQSATFVAALSQ
jgi:hypothetical protein